MSISAISGSIPSLPSLPKVDGVAGAGAGTGGAEGPGGFGDKLVGALDNLQQTHDTADNLATQAATGDLSDAHDYMIAATEASLATEMTVAVRNRAVEAFTSIMQMQV